MIKFVCATCGERLSVPDLQAGRRGMCPTCQSVNRIPLKGMSEVRLPRPNPSPPAPSSVPVSTSPATEEGSVAEQAEDKPVELVAESPVSVEPRPILQAQAFTVLTTDMESSSAVYDDQRVSVSGERKLPHGLKMALLIVGALALVAGLYFGLLLAMKALVPGS